MFPYEYNEFMKKYGISFKCGDTKFYNIPERNFKNNKVLCDQTKYFEYTPEGFNINKIELLKDIFSYFEKNGRVIPAHFVKMLENTKTLLKYNDIDRVFRISTNVIEAIKRNYNNRGDVNNRHVFYFKVKFLVVKDSFIFIYINEFCRVEYGSNITCAYNYSYDYNPEPNLNRVMKKLLIGMKSYYNKEPKPNFTFLYDKEVEKVIRNGNMKYEGYSISLEDGSLTIKFKPGK